MSGSIVQVTFADDSFASGASVQTPATGTGSPGSNFAIGDTIVVVVTGPSAPTSVTDNAAGGSQTYAAKSSAFNSSSSQGVYEYILQNNASATKLQHTATWGSSVSGKGIVAIQATGVTSSSYNNSTVGISNTPGTSANAVTSGAISPSSGGVFCIGVAMETGIGDGSDLAAGTAYTLDGTAFWKFGGSVVLAKIETKSLATVTSTAATFTAATHGGSGFYDVALIMLNESSGSAGSGSTVEGNDASSGTGTQTDSGSGTTAEGHDTSSGTGSTGFAGSGATLEGNDTSSGAGTQRDSGSGTTAEGADASSASGSQTDSGSGTTAEGHDTSAGTGATGFAGAGATTEGADTSAGAGSQKDSGSGTTAEASDASSGTGAQTDAGSGATTEAHDTSTGTGATGFAGVGATVEGNDTSAGAGIIPPQLAAWRTVVQAVRAGSRRARLLTIGDSLTAGDNSTANAMASNAHSLSYPVQMSPLFLGAPAHQDSWFSNNNAASDFATLDQYDYRITLGTGWQADTSNPTLAGYPIIQGSATSSALAFTPLNSLDSFTIWFETFPGSPQYTVNVDGGSSLGTLPMNASAGIGVANFTCAAGTHTINIVSNGTAGGKIFGCEAWLSTSPKIQMFTAGGDSWTAGDWTQNNGNAWDPLAMAEFLAPDLTLVCLGKNEQAQGISQATFETNLRKLVSGILTAGSPVVIFGPPLSLPAGLPSNMTEAAQLAYETNMANVAASLGCTFYSLTQKRANWNSFAAANSAGFMYTGDNIHLTPAGYLDLAKALLTVIDGGVGVTAEASDISAAVGAQLDAGSGSTVEASDVSAGTGGQKISGSGATTEGADVSAGTGAAGSGGFGSPTEGSDQSSGSGSQKDSATSAATESSDASAGVGAEAITGAGATLEGTDTSAAAGLDGASPTIIIIGEVFHGSRPSPFAWSPRVTFSVTRH